ncbi:YjhG/YagF family D-xylonate dehydratase [Propionimicrobium sp. PCR01-08-3]|uniref:YjhG/YagF family D-xylonate dehydratase n=1 Tax=Propionimicrobium sp. PCR01-08-3 TaxID=3052086 RepID=UPI00255CCC27|nr:YjhG/YagF family D-xylonate dehydratase [Propionimicrobium sp. PCR01-08-3]WIY84061.1 YjhG/YagF family D-xylonate dehydratase [Propionimicrobium sp. PCR01-08-3]
MALRDLYTATDAGIYEVRTHAPGPAGSLPITPEQLRGAPSGDLFGMTMNVGMGWNPADVNKDAVMIISTAGGATDADGNPIALGLHTGHYQLAELVNEAAQEVAAQGALPYATYVSDPCDGRSQGTAGMFDSLPYRNDAAIVMRRLIRSLPTRRAVMGIASCDKGLPAMMIALASMHKDPTILIPGGTTLRASDGEDNGAVQTIGVRYASGEMTFHDAADAGCRACASPGGGCQFLGTAGTSQVIGEALGLALTHSALAPSGEPIWHDLARASADALLDLKHRKIFTRDILTDHAIENAMVLHAAFGGSTNLLLHLPAIAFAAGLNVPTVYDWARINADVPRLVSVLPVGPVDYPTPVVYLAGGVPEAMLYLRKLGLLHTDVLTVTGETLDENLDWWASSERRQVLRRRLREVDGVDPDDVILSPEGAKAKGMASTITFPLGNIAPEGSVVKSAAIDPSVIDPDGVFRHTGPAKVFTSEKAAIAAIKQQKIGAGDIMIVLGAGPLGTGMEETYQLTSALKKVPYGKHVSLITDARFSGVSTGACFGHVGPEALAGGPIGKLRDGDIVQIIVDTGKLTGSLDFVGTPDARLSPEQGAEVLAARDIYPGLAPDRDLPDDTRLWAALQDVSGGTWGGCVYDVDRIIEVLDAGKKALAAGE